MPALYLQLWAVATETFLPSAPKAFPVQPFAKCAQLWPRVGASGGHQGEVTPGWALQEGFTQELCLCLKDFQGWSREDGAGEGLLGKGSLRAWQLLGKSLTGIEGLFEQE